MIVVGIDEAGIGCLAGPLVVAAAAFDTGTKTPKGVADSKRLSMSQRESVIDDIYGEASWVLIKTAHAPLINEWGSVWALWDFLVEEILDYCKEKAPGKIIVDGTRMISSHKGVHYEVKADDKYREVSAASVVAKYMQTSIMEDLHEDLPHYGFNKHHGYGTTLHMERIKHHGPSAAHRLFYKPIKEYLEDNPTSGFELRQTAMFSNGHTTTLICSAGERG